MIGKIKDIDEIKDDTYIFDKLPPLKTRFARNNPKDKAGLGKRALVERVIGPEKVTPADFRGTPVDLTGWPTEGMRGQLIGEARIKEFLCAGNATLTIVSKKTGARFTYQCKRPDVNGHKKRPIWVSLLTAGDNEKSYSILGTIWESDRDNVPGLVYNHNIKRSPISEDAPSVEAIKWLVRALNARNANEALEKCEVWHEGKCCRCGRKLTVPESIASGIGPECAKRYAGHGTD